MNKVTFESTVLPSLHLFFLPYVMDNFQFFVFSRFVSQVFGLKINIVSAFQRCGLNDSILHRFGWHAVYTIQPLGVMQKSL